MELVKGVSGRHKSQVRREALSQLYDVGDRLGYVAGRYSRLVRELGEGPVGVPDLGGRVDLINRQLVYAAQRLQEVLLLEHETNRADAVTTKRSSGGERREFRQPVALVSA
jgi:hypothetical protein